MKKIKEAIDALRGAIKAFAETYQSQATTDLTEKSEVLFALVEPKVKERKKRTGRTKLTKLGNDQSVKLQRVDAAAKGTMLRILKLWAEQAEATTSALELSNSKSFDDVAHPLDWARHVIRQAIARGDAEIIGTEAPAQPTEKVKATDTATNGGKSEKGQAVGAGVVEEYKTEASV